LEERIEKEFNLEGTDQLIFSGANDRNFKIIEEHFDVILIIRGNIVKISGKQEEVALVENLLSEMVFIINANKKLSRADLMTAIHIIKGEASSLNADTSKKKAELDSVVLFTPFGYVKPSTPGQGKYVKDVENNDIVFCIGPAGTGKTYLAVALAVAYLNKKQVSKIILSRPAVEAGESLGFLPGDYREKINPYLNPLYDALSDMLPTDVLRKHLEEGVIEVIPLAFMRGRTLNNAFVLLDEGQNCTFLQMKMFLTRLGFNSKCIINGDITQIDLPRSTDSGLLGVQKILDNIDGLKFVYLDDKDVVRHKLVKDIINAYAQDERNKSGSTDS
jgi:phosphate starvation-inducible PhoH-like protein